MPEVLEAVMTLAVGRDGLAVEHATHCSDTLVEPAQPVARAVAEFEPVGRVLELEPRAADAEDCAAVRDVVDGRGHLRYESGIAERIRTDEQPKPDLLRCRGHAGEARPALVDGLV